jgi:TraH_2
MLDAALIEKCADPSLAPAIIEQFIEMAGSPDPLAITVRSGGRMILVPKPKTPDEAMDIIRENIGRAAVRVGLTQFPAGVGVMDASELNADLVDPCENLRMGTKVFAKITRMVAKWYGNPTGKEVLPQIFDDAVYSWKTGEFEGESVFETTDPRGSVVLDGSALQDNQDDPVSQADRNVKSGELPSESDAGKAGIRIDMSRVGGRR